jgi:heat shock protein HtpX
MAKDEIANHRLSNSLHTALLIAGMVVLMSALGLLLAGVNGFLWTSAIAILLMLLGPRVSPRFILRLFGARPLSAYEAPGLYRLVQDLARQANLHEMPRLYYIPSQMMNAFTIGDRERTFLGITDGLLRHLNAQELTGVLAHEVAHIQHNDMRVMSFAELIGRLTRLFATFGQMLLFFNLPLLLLGRSPISWVAIILLIAAPRLTALLQLALSRTREFEADLGAVRLTDDPVGLANALRKMERYEARGLRPMLPPTGRAPNATLLRTHPATGKRIRRLLELAPAGQPTPVPVTVRAAQPWSRWEI